MSEFKFACPICGQHITADSKDTGSEISCPTCYRKIVVPPAPATEDSKFVLSASEANKPRPPATTVSPLEGIQRAPEKTSIPAALIILLVLACGAGATLYALRGKLSHSKPPAEEASDESPKSGDSESPAQPEFTGSNLWTLDLTNATFPDAPVSGSVHRRAFALDRATLTGSNLTLRVGSKGSVQLGVNVYFFNRQAEELSGKVAEVKPGDKPAPRVVLHWLESERKSQTFRSGYAMKVEFGPVTNGALPGKIFLCVPDDGQSWVAGTFRAEIRRPSPPKPRAPTQRPPQTQ
jgi:DNA-directed RNA polymerase subunit RPC12/RpoP